MSRQPVFYCSICGQELLERESACICSFCGKQEQGEWVCPNGHYTCEDCRLASPAEAIERVCLETRSQNPREIADLLMRHPAFKDHGVEHHLLVAPVILAAFANSRQTRVDKAKIQSAIKRLVDIPIGVCGSRGDCGACVGAGAAVSIIFGSGANPAMGRSRALRAAGSALLRLAEMDGHRCCKQSVYAALETGWHILGKELGSSLEMGKITCGFSHKIADCKKGKCPYYNE
ncbi:MAG: DUF5714 domain-containing protein [Candidatus Aminicenantes bacterium]|nr:DUF5714 domain-containing protein [Candidatus Aminicenantes bacterium]